MRVQIKQKESTKRYAPRQSTSTLPQYEFNKKSATETAHKLSNLEGVKAPEAARSSIYSSVVLSRVSNSGLKHKATEKRRGSDNQQETLPATNQWPSHFDVKGLLGSQKENVPLTSKRTLPCNIENFFRHTTPCVKPHYLPKSSIMKNCCRRWQNWEVERVPYFAFGDLWDSFDEWSAYGAGVPIIINSKENAIQYSVPYLSALQLYTRSSYGLQAASRWHGVERDASDQSSDASSDCDYDITMDCSRSCEDPLAFRTNQAYNAVINASSFGSQQLTLRRHHHQPLLPFVFEPQREDVCSNPLFEYFEIDPPYSRVPLYDKVSELTQNFPQLRSLRSIDILPTSWLSIAWYPIYRIPTGPTLRDLSASFLTFHELTMPLKVDRNAIVSAHDCNRGLSVTSVFPDHKLELISLPAFGLVTYKLRGATWEPTGNSERHHLSRLQSSAHAWLRQRQVHHPDFHFFLSHSSLPL